MEGNDLGVQTIMYNLQQADASFGPLNAYCMMLFCLLYVPCAAAIATIRKESASTAFTLKLAAFQIFVAWFMSVLVYQTGSLFIP